LLDLSDKVDFHIQHDQTLMSDLKHKQVPIFEDGEVAFHVDEKLQSIIQFFCDAGIETWNSCQDNVRGKCWIQFELTDWMMLSDISFKSKEQTLYRFIEDQCEVLLCSRDNGHPDANDEYWIEGEDLIWAASVRFPKGKISAFERLIVATIAEMPTDEDDAVDDATQPLM
jgi:hypothetical protein